MKGLSAVFMDGAEVFVDNGAMHAKSRLEIGVKFLTNRDEIPNARHIQGLWISLKRHEGGLGYAGAMPFELWIDDEAKAGFKSLTQHVNQMDKAVRGQVDVSSLDTTVITTFSKFLKDTRPDLWEHASAAFRTAFDDSPANSV